MAPLSMTALAGSMTALAGWVSSALAFEIVRFAVPGRYLPEERHSCRQSHAPFSSWPPGIDDIEEAQG